MQAIQRLPNDAQLAAVEKIVGESIRRECQAFNRRVPEVIVIANEGNPALAAQLLRVSIFSGPLASHSQSNPGRALRRDVIPTQLHSVLCVPKLQAMFAEGKWTWPSSTCA